MKCPNCTCTGIQDRGKRKALYPAGIIAIVGVPFAMLHQVSIPRDYHCNGCGLDFRQRTTGSKIAGIILLCLVAGFTLLFAVLAYALITGEIS